uniref:Macaca fascicularis brain cDNA, clone: QtrA-19027 n=1 Tax=Macaca fascicularis TaxID=9541 RepID=I7GF75_MACFA|nr:unnamed protein product [Macaca fascicularis]
MIKLRFRGDYFPAIVKHLERGRTGIQTQVTQATHFLIYLRHKDNIMVEINCLSQEIFQLKTQIWGLIFIAFIHTISVHSQFKISSLSFPLLPHPACLLTVLLLEVVLRNENNKTSLFPRGFGNTYRILFLVLLKPTDCNLSSYLGPHAGTKQI